MSEIDKQICGYIVDNWIGKSKSNRAFAKEHNISESLVRKLRNPNGHGLKVSTLKKICDSKNISLQYFFWLVQQQNSEGEFEGLLSL